MPHRSILILSLLFQLGTFSAFAQDSLDDLSGAPLLDEGGRLFRQIDDMLLEVQGLGALSVQPRSVRLWPNGILPVAFDQTYPEDQRVIFFEACGWWSEVANVRCVPRSVEEHFVFVRPANENSSFVGRIAMGRQDLNLFNRRNRGIIAHEIAHALGFAHQHNAPDRDRHVRILWENINEGAEHNFRRLSVATTFGQYDYCSIMHYPVDAFSFTGRPTIELLRGADCVVGRLNAISYADKLGMMGAYGPSGSEESKVDVPRLIRMVSSSEGPRGVYQQYGLHIAVRERRDNDVIVESFPTPDLRTTSCVPITVIDQDPRPTAETGLRAEFGSVINVTISRTCWANPDGRHSDRRCMEAGVRCDPH